MKVVFLGDTAVGKSWYVVLDFFYLFALSRTFPSKDSITLKHSAPPPPLYGCARVYMLLLVAAVVIAAARRLLHFCLCLTFPVLLLVLSAYTYANECYGLLLFLPTQFNE